MADLTGGRDADRGQLILITGLTMAVVLVALVLLVNTVIYAGTLATRDADAGDESALAYREAVGTGVGGIVDRENAAGYDDRSNLEANVTSGTEQLDFLLSRSHLRSGQSATVNRTTLSYDEGQLVRQDDFGRDFTDQSGLLVNWTMAWNIDDTRKYAMTVDRSALAQANESDPTGAFRVVLASNSTSDEWRAYIYENRTTGDIAVAVKNVTESSPTEVCSVNAASATVGLTNGTLAGEDCSGLDWARGLSGRYDIVYRNGDNAAGTYNLTVNTTGSGALNTLNLLSGAVSGSPRFVPAVYAADVTVTYRSPSLVYRVDLRVAPGEPDD